jgi:hypothetical protein
MKKPAKKLSPKVKLSFPALFVGLLTTIFAIFALKFFFQNENLKKQLRIKTEEMVQINSQVGRVQSEAEEASSLQTKNFARVSLLIINRIELRFTNAWLFLYPNEPVVNQAREAEIKALLAEGRDVLGAFTDLPAEAEKLRGQMFALENEIISFLPQLEKLTKIDLEKEQKNKTRLYQRAMSLLNRKEQIKTELIRLSGRQSVLETLPPPVLPTAFPTPGGCTRCQ